MIYYVEAFLRGKVTPSFKWGYCDVSNFAARMRGLHKRLEGNLYILAAGKDGHGQHRLHLGTHLGESWIGEYRDFVDALYEDNTLRLTFQPSTLKAGFHVSQLVMNEATLVSNVIHDLTKDIMPAPFPRRATLEILLAPQDWITLTDFR